MSSDPLARRVPSKPHIRRLTLALGLAATACVGVVDDGELEATDDGEAIEGPQALGADPSAPPPQPMLDDVAMGIGGLAFDGELAGDLAGFDVAAVGDVNADGLGDFIVGAPKTDTSGTNSGAAYVVFGDAAFPPGPLQLGLVGGTIAGTSFTGEVAFDSAGNGVGGGGDFNGDGIADFLIGATGFDAPGKGAAGRTYVVFGSPALTWADNGLESIEAGFGWGGAYGIVIDGETVSDMSGTSVANAGDVNGDTFDDILIAAPNADPNGTTSGRVYLVYGAPWAPTTALSLADVAAGIGGVAFDGEAFYDAAGSSIAGAGDINGDGFDDILIGAPGNDAVATGAGRAYVVYGASSLGSSPVALSAIAAGTGGFALQGISRDSAGDSVRGAGDVNGDGLADILVSAHLAEAPGADAGRGHVFFGSATPPTSPVALATVASGPLGIGYHGQTAYDYTSYRQAGLGDINGDGLDDVGVGAYSRNNASMTDAGVGYVLFGGDDPAMTSATDLPYEAERNAVGGFHFHGESASDQATRSAFAGLGDVNGDGTPDIGVGVVSPATSAAGRVYVLFGDPALGEYSRDYNRAPNPVADSYEVVQGGVLNVVAPGLLANDADHDLDTFNAVAASPTSLGGAAVTIAADGSFTYTPAPELWGIDTFTYTVIDQHGATRNGIVSVTVVPVAIGLEEVAAGLGGYALDGEADFDGAGQAVSLVGDIDRDGFADVLIGAHEASPGMSNSAGATYVAYGAPSSASPIALTLGATDAAGESSFDWAGIAVSGIGDFDGNGYADFAYGAIGVDPGRVNRAGRTYVVLGGSPRPSNLPGGLTGSNGFYLDGENVDDDSGRSITAAGDLNGDGFDDFAISAYRSDAAGQDAGRSYVVFGTDAGYSAAGLDLAVVGVGMSPEPDGFIVDGEAVGDFAGFALAGGGDLNGDGYDDLVVGAYFADPTGDASGRTYVISGAAMLPGAMSLADVADPMMNLGVAIDGEYEGDLAGRSLAIVGDVDGDGTDDLAIGAPAASPTASSSGRSYLVFGGTAFDPGAPTISLATVAGGTGGVAIDGETDQDGSGSAIARAGDFNGDGFADLVIGAPLASSATVFGSGRAYLVLGSPDLPTTPSILLGDVAQGVGGFAIDGELTFDAAGHAVSGGHDINHDHYDDIVVGAYQGGPSMAGRTYVIYGGAFVPDQGAGQ